jgi:hypothetical protein
MEAITTTTASTTIKMMIRSGVEITIPSSVKRIVFPPLNHKAASPIMLSSESRAITRITMIAADFMANTAVDNFSNYKAKEGRIKVALNNSLITV